MRTVLIDTPQATLEAGLTRPDKSKGIVIFAHGSGSSRHSPRNRYVADVLTRHGFATLLLDLLSKSEEDVDRRTAAYRFDIGLLATRLGDAARWTIANPDTRDLPIGYFGASTGAAAALVAACRGERTIHAIVSRGGRPDLVEPELLGELDVPTLFIVGRQDTEVLRLNRDAAAHIAGVRELAVVDGATHLFEEQGALARVSWLAGRWFRRYLRPGHFDPHAAASDGTREAPGQNRWRPAKEPPGRWQHREKA